MKNQFFKTCLVIALMIGNTTGSYAEPSAKLPFIGTKSFNFAGGTGTVETVTIKKDGTAIFKFIGSVSSSVTYRGKFQPIMTIDKGESYLKITSTTIELLDKNKQPIFGCDENGIFSEDYTERCIQELYLEK
ncbi:MULTISPECIES: hypothetical protein [unclassified Moraxella]|uniref:hypothetical protein n=1 Tax=unclassified Moraxella TaxID=2685852 RepID=UPI003AF9C29C